MEKRTPHYRLHTVKELIALQKVRTTHSARSGAAALGMDYADMTATVAALQGHDFYKSMTTHADHTIWQDVYRPQTPYGTLYIKLTVLNDLLIVSFKEK